MQLHSCKFYSLLILQKNCHIILYLIEHHESKSFNPGTTFFSSSDDFLTLLKLYLKYLMKSGRRKTFIHYFMKHSMIKRRIARAKAPSRRRKMPWRLSMAKASSPLPRHPCCNKWIKSYKIFTLNEEKMTQWVLFWHTDEFIKYLYHRLPPLSWLCTSTRYCEWLLTRAFSSG